MNDLAAQTVKPSLTGCYLKLKASFFAMWLNSACTDRGLQLEQGACTQCLGHLTARVLLRSVRGR